MNEMSSAPLTATIVIIMMGILCTLPVASAATGYLMTLQTDHNAYSGAQRITVFGTIASGNVGPGTGTAIVIFISNPAGTLVDVETTNVDGSTGSYTQPFYPGGNADWIEGTYTVNATWGAHGARLTKLATFTYGPAPPPTTRTVSVAIPLGSGSNKSLNFSPSSITVIVGVNNTILWTNRDPIEHTVASLMVPAGAPQFMSGILDQGATFEATLSVPGTYTYDCTIHPQWMIATIRVLGANPTTTTTSAPEFPPTLLALTSLCSLALVSLLLRRREQRRHSHR